MEKDVHITVRWVGVRVQISTARDLTTDETLTVLVAHLMTRLISWSNVWPRVCDLACIARPDMITSLLEAFMQYELALVEQVQDQVASAMPTRFVSVT